MTGLYPDQTGVHENAVYVRAQLPNVQTMPQTFRESGYFATRIGKIYHYSVPAHIGTGGHDDPYSWDYTINPRGRDKDDESQVFSLRPENFGATLSWLAADGDDEEQTDGIAATEAIRLLERFAQQSRPFFLAVGLYRPHTPYVSPKRYFDLYSLDMLHVPKVPAGYLDTLPATARRSVTRFREQVNLADDIARHAMQAYYASITFADAQIGRLLDALQATGLADNTIVVLTSDHGYHMGEHGHWQKSTLFEDATRVPLIIATPGSAVAGKATVSMTEMIDIFPTLAELCGLQPPAGLSGVSLAPLWTNPRQQLREASLTQFENGYSIRTPSFRYTQWSDGAELYDHETDPDELHNLANDPDHRTTAEELSQLLKRRIALGKVRALRGKYVP